MSLNAVSVALLTNPAGDLLWVWDDAEGCFALPTAPQHADEADPPRRAAQTAAARAVGVPVVVGQHVRLGSASFGAGRATALHPVAFDVFRVAPHADFAAALAIRAPHLWLPVHKALRQEDEYEPFSPVSRWVVASLVHEEWLQGRTQSTAVLVLRRLIGGRPHFLLRHEPDWGYTLPSKRRKAGESYPDAARRVAKDELKVHPAEVGLADGQFVVIRDRAYSKSEHADTIYHHGVFERTLADDVAFESDAPLIWADLNTIAGGAVTPAVTTITGAAAPPALISSTVTHILTERQLIK